MDVSIIIPFRDKPELLNNCLSTFHRLCMPKDGLSVEFVLVDNGSTQETLDKLEFPKALSIKSIRADVPFNFQNLVNIGAKESVGDYLLLLNNDIIFTEKSSNFLQKMLESARLPQAGAVGGLLLYEDGTIQHAGVVVGMGGFADHLYRTWTKDQSKHFVYTPYDENRQVSAVTAACLMVEAKKYHEIGGFDERFVVCGGDVDFCLRLSAAGYSNFYRGDFELIHLESKSRDPSKIPEIDFVESQRSYGAFLRLHNGRDPFYPEPLPLQFEPDRNFLGRRFRKVQNKDNATVTHFREPSKTGVQKLRARLGNVRRRIRDQPFELAMAHYLLKARRKLVGNRSTHFRVERTAKSFAIPHALPIRHHREFPVNPAVRLNVLLPHLEPRGIYGGIATAALIALKFKMSHPSIDLRFVLTDGEGSFEALDSIMRPFFGSSYDQLNYEIQTLYNRHKHSLGVHQKDQFLATAWWTCNSAQSICGDKPFIYLIQDYEPCFYPWSEEFAGAAASYRMNFTPIFNTDILKDFFLESRIVKAEQIEKGTYFNPAIDGQFFKPKEVGDRKSGGKKKLFFYGRPSVARNLFSTGVQALAKGIESGLFDPREWEFISAGEMHDPVELGRGVYLSSLGKISYSQYAGILKEIDIGMSLMLSPHPSYPPLEIAAVGSLCVTNTYANKDLTKWHPNVVSCDPSVEGVFQGLRLAVDRLKAGQIVDPKLAIQQSKISYNWDQSLESTLELIHAFCSR